jgi:hypothetical protein
MDIRFIPPVPQTVTVILPGGAMVICLPDQVAEVIRRHQSTLPQTTGIVGDVMCVHRSTMGDANGVALLGAF